MKLTAIDLFSGCGGLTTRLIQANISVKYAVEIDSKISQVYEVNHPEVNMINDDITNITDEAFKKIGEEINLVAGCPPCQGFTKINRNNKNKNYNDKRNLLIEEFYRAIKNINPEFIMMENVPEIINYDKFKNMVGLLKEKYNVDFKVINVKNFGVPQNRRRLVLIASKKYEVNFPTSDTTDMLTVRDAINPHYMKSLGSDPLKNIYSHHTERIMNIIKMIPKDGGSRKDLPKKYWLNCHKKANVGYTDVYGRMSWDKPSPTITGGCLFPSKGRFLHPEFNRSISVREAALLQTFPSSYYFDPHYSKTLLAQMIGNAIPPKVAKFQGEYIKKLLR